MTFNILNFSKFNAFVFAILALASFSSCEFEDGDVELDIKNNSPFYIKINIEGNVIDVNHGLSYQALPDLSYENGCDILFNDCSASDQKVYLASSFGPNSQNLVNLAFTNLAISNTDLNNPNLLEIVNNLPIDDNNSLLFTSGTLEDGITSGNVFIGTVDYKFTYIHEQKSWARFRIIQVQNETLNEESVIGIRFEID